MALRGAGSARGLCTGFVHRVCAPGRLSGADGSCCALVGASPWCGGVIRKSVRCMPRFGNWSTAGVRYGGVWAYGVVSERVSEEWSVLHPVTLLSDRAICLLGVLVLPLDGHRAGAV